jgi:hypothetical protein
MAQEFKEDINTQSQEMEEVIDLLEKYNIDFEVEGNKIMINGDVRYVDLSSMSTIVITQGDNRIIFDRFMEWNRLSVDLPTRVGFVRLSKNVRAYYKYPYLVIRF